MHRLLIVDDEHHIVDWLVELFEEQQDMDLEVLKAYSGQDALRILSHFKIDIILLDIKMPGLNGLDVADKITLDWPACRIIFLTGYNNFEYIYRANKKKHISYLLKLEDDDEIISAVVSAISDIEIEDESLSFISHSKQADYLLQHLIQREFLKDVLKGKPIQDVNNYLKWYAKYFYLDTSQPVYLLYSKLIQSNLTPYMLDHHHCILDLFQVMTHILGSKFKFALLDIDSTSILWLFQSTESFSQTSYTSPFIYLKEHFNTIITMCEKTLNCNFTALLHSSPIAWEQIGNTYELLHKYFTTIMVRNSNLHSYGMIFGENEKKQILDARKNMSHDSDLSIQLNSLSSYMYQGDKDSFTHTLSHLKSLCLHIQSMHHLPTIKVFQTITLLYINYISHYNLQEKICLQIGLYPLYYINDFNTWAEAFEYLERLSNIIFQCGSLIEIDKNKALIQNIKKYVNTHISSDLTLTSISESVNYNSSYISRLFKQITGISLSSYINQVRMEKAQKLLQDTHESIQSISIKVGFDTSQYFSIVFRKTFGISPSDYRNQYYSNKY